MTGPQHREPRLRKHSDLIEAVSAMKLGDPPLRWDLEKEEYHNVMASLARYCPGTWRHFWKGQLWIVKYE